MQQDFSALMAQMQLKLSPAIVEKLTLYHELLLRWQNVKNLVAPSTLDDIWLRHFADSAQLLRIAPNRGNWLDLGSGAGFPGLIIAILKSDDNFSRIRLIESDHRKCAFLREVSRETGADAEIICSRIEASIENFPDTDVVTARAVAPLSVLINYSHSLLERGAAGFFLKGQGVEQEISQIKCPEKYNIVLKQSMTDRAGKIVVVSVV